MYFWLNVNNIKPKKCLSSSVFYYCASAGNVDFILFIVLFLDSRKYLTSVIYLNNSNLLNLKLNIRALDVDQKKPILPETQQIIPSMIILTHSNLFSLLKACIYAKVVFLNEKHLQCT